MSSLIFGKKKKTSVTEEASTAPANGTDETMTSELVLSSTPSSTGLLILAEPKLGIKTTVDVVFIHGLRGNRERTWTSLEQPACFWPRDLLPLDLTAARIMTWDYNAGVSGISPRESLSASRIRDHALDLVVTLTHNRVEARVSFVLLLVSQHSMAAYQSHRTDRLCSWLTVWAGW